MREIERRVRVVPPIASTDCVNFDRRPTQEERGALLAYLRKQYAGSANGRPACVIRRPDLIVQSRIVHLTHT